MADTEAIRQIVNRYEDAVSTIQADKDLTEEARTRRVRELGEGVLESWGKARKELADAFDSEQAALEAKASVSGARTEPTDTQTELRAMRSELAARDVLDGGQAGAIFEAYEQAVADGDEAAMGVFERRAPGKLTDLDIPLSERQRFEELISRSIEARMTPEQRQARDELDALNKRRDSAEMGISMQQEALLTRVRARRA